MALRRREFLKIATVGGVGLALSVACTPQATTPTPAAKDAGGAAPAKPGEAAKPAASGGTPKQGGDLAIGFWSEARSLDPNYANAPAVRGIMLLYDTMVVQTPDFKQHPALAESWEV